MISQAARWVAGRVIRSVYGSKEITRPGEAGASFRFRPSENPVLLQGLARVYPAARRQWALILQPGEMILDIGANIGFTVQRFHALLGGDCRIVAFEPMPRNLALLEANCAALSGGAVSIIPKAIGSKDGTAVFQQNSEHGALSRMESATGEAAQRYGKYWQAFTEVEVEVARLDSFIRHNPDIRPTFVKVDVEGAGGMVLEGALDTIGRFKPAFDCEFHGSGESDAMLATLRRLGYGAVVFHGQRPRWAAPSAEASIFVHPDDPRVAKLAITGPPPTSG